MDVAGALAAISAALKLVGDLRDINNEYDKAEMKLKIADLTTALADAKHGLVDVAEDIRKHEAEIVRLKGLLAFRSEKLIDKGQFRYFSDGEGNPKGAPICSVCEQKGNHLAVVQDRSKGIGKITYYCPSCIANYGPRVPMY